RQLRVWVQSNSFALYSYFSNVEMAGDYWITGNTFTGPAHTNGHFNFAGTPAFADQTTSSNSDEQVGIKGDPAVFDPTRINYNTANITGGDVTNAGILTDPKKFYHVQNGGGNTYTNTFPKPLNNSPTFS